MGGPTLILILFGKALLGPLLYPINWALPLTRGSYSPVQVANKPPLRKSARPIPLFALLLRITTLPKILLIIMGGQRSPPRRNKDMVIAAVSLAKAIVASGNNGETPSAVATSGTTRSSDTTATGS